MDALGDTFWYVAAGRVVLDTGALPSFDPFSYTAPEKPWTLLMPGSYTLFALTERQFGLTALLALCAAVEGLAWTLCWTRAAPGAPRALLLPLVLLGPWLQRDDLAARGQVFGDLCFCLLLVLLLECTKATRTRGLVWTVAAVPLGALWTNLHPSALLALVVPPCFALGLLLEQRAFDTRVRSVGALWAGLMVGSLMNPYGAALPIEHLSLALSSSTRSLDLFLPPDFRRSDVWIVLVVSAGGLVWVLRSGRARLARALLLFGMLVAGVGGRRYLPLLLMTTVAFLGHGCRLRLEALEAYRRWLLALGGVTLSCLVAWGLGTEKDPLKHVPTRSVAFIARHHLPQRFFNPYHFGGYLDYAWGPRGVVFIDGRNQVFDGGHTFEAHHHITLALPGWERLLAIYGVNTALVERGSPIAEALARHPAWQRRFSEPIAEVFVRRGR